MDPIQDLDPKPLFRHFAALLAIPRGSGNEAAAREYVRAFAREHGFDARIDGAGNIVVAVPATPGHEGAPIVVLQAHLDMVCEKDSAVEHDFAHDPIPAYVDGDRIATRGTTLGADNGIGVAAALGIGEDPACIHGPLELLCTVDEEVGLTGAFNLNGANVRGRILLNLDSEDEGTLFVGCAGGGDTGVRLPVARGAAPEGHTAVTVRVAGLQGGHSGLEIARGRGNAIRVLARAVEAACEGGPEEARLSCLAGGSKRNAIPREASACVWLPEGRAGAFVAAVGAFEAQVRAELGAADPDVRVWAAPEACAALPLDGPASGRAWRLLLALPHGPLAMSQAIPGLVETSTNLALATLKDDGLEVTCNSRSSIGSAMEAVRLQIRAIAELAGGSATLGGSYPGWRPDMGSKVLAVAREVWRHMADADPQITAIHAGLECGVIGEKCPGMDMVSFGPDIRGVHSPAEHVSIASTGRFYAFLKQVLRALA